MDQEFKKELRKGSLKSVKLIPAIAWFVIPCILFIAVFAYALNFRLQARQTASGIGEIAGTAAGKVSGSLNALKNWYPTLVGAQKKGLDPDTEVDLTTKICEVGRLEVLLASGTYTDIISINKKDKVEYAALISQKYNAVFTVDLKNATYAEENDGLHITLEQPVVEFVPDGSPDVLSKYIRNNHSGSAEKGYTATDNALNELSAKAEQELHDNESLMNAARNSSVTQLKQLGKALSVDQKDIYVVFKGSANND